MGELPRRRCSRAVSQPAPPGPGPADPGLDGASPDRCVGGKREGLGPRASTPRPRARPCSPGRPHSAPARPHDHCRARAARVDARRRAGRAAREACCGLRQRAPPLPSEHTPAAAPPPRPPRVPHRVAWRLSRGARFFARSPEPTAPHRFAPLPCASPLSRLTRGHPAGAPPGRRAPKRVRVRRRATAHPRASRPPLRSPPPQSVRATSLWRRRPAAATGATGRRSRVMQRRRGATPPPPPAPRPPRATSCGSACAPPPAARPCGACFGRRAVSPALVLTPPFLCEKFLHPNSGGPPRWSPSSRRRSPSRRRRRARCRTACASSGRWVPPLRMLS